jgi:hypothetical protein
MLTDIGAALGHYMCSYTLIEWRFGEETTTIATDEGLEKPALWSLSDPSAYGCRDIDSLVPVDFEILGWKQTLWSHLGGAGAPIAN